MRLKSIILFLILNLALFPLLPSLGIDFEKEEEYWKAEVEKKSKDQAYAIEQLARIRERMGKFQLAIDTWGFLKKMHGEQNAFNESSAPDVTYAELADFKIQRLRRVLNQIANPPVPPNPELRKKLIDAQEVVRQSVVLGEAGYIHLMMPVDMDGDLIPELLTIIGEREKQRESARMIILIHKWKGSKYVEVFRWRDVFNLGVPEEPGFRVVDMEGWGMYSVVVTFERGTDNSAAIQSNGETIMWAN
ncbi:MAG: hypothetical protein QME62_00915 [Armatimonadota bacterium]|nr:hypothetical protein [Armatimonadota bacterium]